MSGRRRRCPLHDKGAALLGRVATRLRRAPSVPTLWLGGTLLLWALYTLVFVQTIPDTWASAANSALANVLPLSLLAAAVHALLKGSVMHWPVWLQAAAHAGLAIGFAVTWYALVLVTLAFFNGLQGLGYGVSGFSGRAFTWQVFQGLVLYAAIAAVCYAVRGGREAANVAIVNMPPAAPLAAPLAALSAADSALQPTHALAPPPLQRYLTKAGDDMLPVLVRDIVTITGAQDYVEVATLTGRHLVRMSLAEFERRLDPARFIRVHRSTLINFDHLTKAEPAGGGRMRVYMANGEQVQASRAGAQSLRELIV